MALHDDPPDHSDASQTIDEVAARATGVAGDHGTDRGIDSSLTAVRAHLEAARRLLDGDGATTGPDGRLARVARRGMRAVAEDRHAFDRELLAAVENLADLVAQRARAAGTVAREGPAPDEPTTPTSAGEDRHGLIGRLAVAGRPSPEVLTRWAGQVAGIVEAAAGPRPVIDLVPGRGEWLDHWRDRGLDVRGVEPEEHRVDALAGRGLRVEVGDPATTLRRLAPMSVGAITAATLADVIGLDELVDVVDGAAVALAPGGVLVLVAAHPLSLSWSDPQWADPRRRPLHPGTAEALVLDRGFTEAHVVDLADTDDRGPAVRAYALVARTASATRPS